MSTYNMTAPSEGYVPSIFQPRKNVIESRSGGCCGVQRSLRRFFRRRGFGAYLYWFKVAVALAGTTVLWLGAWNLSQCVAACHACTQHSVAAVWCWGSPQPRARTYNHARARARAHHTHMFTDAHFCMRTRTRSPGRVAQVRLLAHARSAPLLVERYSTRKWNNTGQRDPSQRVVCTRGTAAKRQQHFRRQTPSVVGWNQRTCVSRRGERTAQLLQLPSAAMAFERLQQAVTVTIVLNYC